MARDPRPMVLIVSVLFLLTGCIASATPEWGADGVEVTLNDDSADVKSELGPNSYSESLTLGKCGDGEFTITGWLISSVVYESHTDDVQSYEKAMAAAVIIDKMTWREAVQVEMGPRVDLKHWITPLYPEEAVGSKLSEHESEWAVIGIIPGSENVADNLNVLDEWQQAITIKGYLVVNSGEPADQLEADSCNFAYQAQGMIITSIEVEEGVVSANGDHDDEWALGDTDYFGRWAFVVFFLVVGGGGGFVMFTFSTMMIRQGAKSSAKTLLGREGFAKAIQMKRDLKQSKKEDLGPRAPTKQKPKAAAPKVKEEKELAGFSLDNILSTDSDDSGPTEFGGGGSGSVTVAPEVKDKAAVSAPQVTQTSYEPVATQSDSMYSGSSVTSSQPEPAAKRQHFSSAMRGSSINDPTPASQPTKGAKPVKRRTVKKRKAAVPEPEPEPEPVQRESSEPSVAGDDFNDFSL
jgi:hypothetical protein